MDTLYLDNMYLTLAFTNESKQKIKDMRNYGLKSEI